MKRRGSMAKAAPLGIAGWMIAVGAALLAAGAARAATMTPYDVNVEASPDFQPLPIPGGGPVTVPNLDTDWVGYPFGDEDKSSGSAALVFPFPVRFFGTYYAEGAAGVRSLLTFGPRAETLCGGDPTGYQGTPATYPSCANNRDSITGPIPRPNYANRLVAVWWSRQMYCSGDDARVRYQTVGEAPNRSFVIEWSGCGPWAGPQVDQQVWLREGSATIEVRYGERSMVGGGQMQAYVGLMSPPAAGGAAEGYNGLLCSRTVCGALDYPAGQAILYSQGPDLAIESVTTGAQIAFAGRPLQVAARMINVGGTRAQEATVRFLVSSKPTLDGDAVELALGEDFHELGMDESAEVGAEVVLPADLAPGTYYLIAQADPTHAEAGDRNAANNVKASNPIVINPRMPYLSVERVEPPAAIVPGSTFSLAWTIRNDGSASAPAIPYAVMLSADDRISVADRLIGLDQVTLEAFSEESRVIDVLLPADVPEGTYYVGLLLDPDRTLPDSTRPKAAGASEPILVSASELRVLTTSLPPATLGASWCLRLDAAGGGARQLWSLAAGSSLPPGLRLDVLPAGALEAGRPFVTMLCGTPSMLGTFPFTLEVKAGVEQKRADYELEVGAVLAPLQVATTALPMTEFMAAYDTSLRGAGGAPPYHWKLIGGRLPAGLALRSDGGILGAAMEDGRFPFTVRLIDAEGRGVDRALALLVSAPNRLTCGTRMLPAHEVGEAYALSLSAAGGTKPYRWRSRETRRLAVELGESAVTLGAEPPPGLELSGLGEVGGAPSQSGRYLWTVEVSDAAAARSEDLCTIVVDVAAERGLTISTLGLLPAVAGQRYRVQLSAAGGEGALSWALLPGSRLPAGLSLNHDGTIEGSPEVEQLESKASRDFAFAVEVQDAHGRRGLAPLSIQVRASGKVSSGASTRKSGGGCAAAQGGDAGLALVGAFALGAFGGIASAARKRFFQATRSRGGALFSLARLRLAGAARRRRRSIIHPWVRARSSYQTVDPLQGIQQEQQMSSSKSPLLLSCAALLLAFAAGACSCNGPGTKGQQPDLRHNFVKDPSGMADYWLDFGDVTVGARMVEPIELRNSGAQSLELKAQPLSEPFSVERLEGGISVAVGATETVGFAFAPTEPMESPVEAMVTIDTNQKNAPKRTVRLSGRGVPPQLSCTPAPLDFGRVVRGSERTLTANCTNTLEIPLHLAQMSFRGNSAGSFAATLSEQIEAPATIPAGGSIGIRIRFRADLNGLNEAVLQLRDPNDQPLGTLPVTGVAVISALRIEPASCLDFGYVDLGSSLRKELLLKNVGTEELQILGLKIGEGGSGDFSLHTQAPIRLGKDEERTLAVEFEPSVGGRQTVSIEVLTDEALVTACVSGFGGGPRIVCRPNSMEFGQVAIGAPVKRDFVCSNEGFAPAGEPIDPLMVLGLETDQPAFEATLIGPDRSPIQADPKGYVIGKGFVVQVTFAPSALGYVAGDAIIRTNGSGGEHRTPIAGEGVDLPPCDFSIQPPQLRFGVVDRGAEDVQTFGIVNNADTACLINALRLSDDSDPSFTVAELPSQVLAGGETLAIPVRFAPKEYGDYAGAVEFQISNPEEREQRVSLRGRSAKPCVVVEPNPVDFGKTAPGCESRDQVVTISNVCGVAIELTDVGIHDTLYGNSFQIRRLPELPAVLEPHGRTEALVRFRPRALGMIEGALYVEVDGGAAEPDIHLSRLVGEGSNDGTQTDRFIQQERPKVDVLWVVDNSGSMGSFQDIIRDRLPQFLSYALAQDIDFQIGVTTTSTTLFPTNICCPGGAQCVENGRLFPADGRQMTPPWPRILTSRTPNIEDVWRFNVKVGVCSGAEVPLEAALRALSPPLIDSAQDLRPNKTGSYSWNDGNLGFLRDDAALSIVMITDEMDHSDFGKTPLDYLEAYRNLKSPRFRSSLKVHAITVPRSQNPIPTCGDFMDRGDRLIDVVEATKGEWFNICTPTNNAEAWNQGLEKMSKGAFGVSLRYVLRGKPGPRSGTGPVSESDIEVFVDGERILPKKGSTVVWTYDPVGNAVDFASLFVPKPGSNISVTYRVACITE